MARNPTFGRRDFLTGVFRRRDPVKAKLGDDYRFGRQDAARISGDVAAPEHAAGLPDWEPNIDLVLKEMNDLTGIVDP